MHFALSVLTMISRVLIFALVTISLFSTSRRLEWVVAFDDGAANFLAERALT